MSKIKNFLFIFFKGYVILNIRKSIPPYGGYPLKRVAKRIHIYFFFFEDFLDFFFLVVMSWRAVNTKTTISKKSFAISSTLCIVSISFSLLSMFILYLFWYIVNLFLIVRIEKSGQNRKIYLSTLIL